MENKNKKTNKRVNGSRLLDFVWPWKKKPNIKTNKKINSKYIAWVAMSVASGFIDFIFFCNMTKSFFEIGTLFQIPAAIVYGYISICLTYSKALHSIEINSLNQIKRYMDKTAEVSKTFSRVKLKWFAIYILYVCISIMTSASLSTISIGEGIHRNQSVIKSINADISKLQKYYNTEDKSNDLQFQSLVEGISSSTNAINIAQEKFSKIQPIIKEYRQERSSFREVADYDSFEEIEWNGQKIIPNSYWDKRNSKVLADVAAAGVRLEIKQIREASDQQIQQIIKNAQEKLTTNTSVKDLTALTEATKNKYIQEIKNLKNKYKDPLGNYIVFDENDLSGTISKLEMLRVSYENDSGDVGSSAKIFMQIGSSFSDKKDNKDLVDIAKETATLSSFGTTEKLMMFVLFFFGLLLELGINQFAPTGELTREGLGEFRKYFPKNFNVSEFMFEIAKKKLEFGDITEEQFLKEKKECEKIMKLSNMKLGEDFEDIDEIKKELENTKKQNEKIVNELTETRNKLFKINLEKNKEKNQVDNQLKEEQKEEENKKEPKEEVSKKLVVLPAERELLDMINN